MNAGVALLQIASQMLEQCRNGGGRMPRVWTPPEMQVFFTVMMRNAVEFLRVSGLSLRRLVAADPYG